jgi:E3 ubiquitin-protein ligase ATL6/9/15/31/42/55
MDSRHIAPPPAVLFLVLLSTAARPSLAQPSNNSTSGHHSRTAGGFTPTTVIVLVALVSAFVVLTLFSIYINRCAPTRPPPQRPSRPAPAPPDHHHHQASSATGGGGGGGVLHPERRARAGLDKEAVVSFPTAVYGDVKARVSGSGPLECAVCLAAFEDRDELRVLPACCHVFHPGCIDPWLAGAATCPLCRADLTAAAPHPPPASSSGSSSEPAVREREQEARDEERDEEARLVAAFTPESVMSFGAARPHEFVYRRTQSAMDVPDRHTLRLPEHVMKELAAVRRHRRAASLAVYPDGVERAPGWLASFWRSVPWQRPSRTDSDAVDEHGGSKRVFPIAGAPSERPSGSGDATDEEKADRGAGA